MKKIVSLKGDIILLDDINKLNDFHNGTMCGLSR